jgi:hypothetical protein
VSSFLKRSQNIAGAFLLSHALAPANGIQFALKGFHDTRVNTRAES